MSKDSNTWEKSTSGGAFTEICKAYNSDNTYFVGAMWDGLYVRHAIVDSINDIYLFQKSKYISSDLGETFREIKKLLNDGKRVLFSGTPCQVAGLKNYLNHNYDNLFLIDLICHGVGSQKVFFECIKYYEQKYECSVIGYEFRSKKNVYRSDYISKYLIQDKSKIKEMLLEKDEYNQLFLSQRCIRKSCGENCKYRTRCRGGDITLADFKGLEQVFPELLGTKKNYSTIVFNTTKGKKLFEELSKNLKLKECLIENIEEYNPLFSKQTWYATDRNEFFEDFLLNPQMAISKWTMEGRKIEFSLLREIFNRIPCWLRRQIYRIRRWKQNSGSSH